MTSFAVKRTIREIKKRDEVKAKALEKGWRSRGTLLFKAWIGCGSGSHLEWLGFYEKAAEVRSKYKFGMKETAQLTAGLATNIVNGQLNSGIYDSLNNTVTYGHIDNSKGIASTFKLIASMAYSCIEIPSILFGKYKTDAFGLPVCWKKPRNLSENIGSSVDNSVNE